MNNAYFSDSGSWLDAMLAIFPTHKIEAFGLTRHSWLILMVIGRGDALDILVTLVEKYKETRWPIQSPANADRHCKILDRAFQAGR